jgi:hypothetical protein
MGITDQLLMAYVDGELAPDLAALILSRLETEPDLLDRMEQQQELRRQLSAVYGSVMAEPLPPGLMALLTKEGAAAGTPRRRPERSVLSFSRLGDAWPAWAAAAAAALVGVGLTEAVHAGDPITRSSDGRILASGPLARSLEDALSSHGGTSGPKIMASFEDHAGRYCRVFEESGQQDGVACKDGDRWQVMALAASTETAPAEGYRQAASALAPSVAAAVDELQGADVLTPEQERRARAQQWQVRGKGDQKSSRVRE